MIDLPEVWLSLGLSLLAVFVWAVLMGRNFISIRHHHESRYMTPMMFIVGLAASVGTFASAVGSAQVSDLFGPGVDLLNRDAIIFIAGIGRGALLIGGLALLTCCHGSTDRAPKEKA